MDFSNYEDSVRQEQDLHSGKMLVAVDFQYLTKVNYAMQQAGTQIVRSVVFENKSRYDLKDFQFSIESDVEFIKPVFKNLPSIPAGKSAEIKNWDVQLSVPYLLQLTECVNAVITLKVASEGVFVFQHNYPVSIFPFSEWTGVSVEPALLAAFVMPNLPALVFVQRRASEILGKWRESDGFEGYQRKSPDRVQKMSAAIYEALRERNIRYIMPPRSFDGDGQKVRLPDEVLNNGMGTCLDTSLLYASCIESVGLNSFVVLMREHAFAGVWLVPECAPNNPVDDVAFLSKNLELGNILLVETTLLTEDGYDFSQACAAGRAHLEKEKDFEYVIDVERARIDKILPLPVRRLVNGVWEISEEDFERQRHRAPKKIDRYEIGESEAKAPNKKDFWENKLLDLSLRNSMLNFRSSKKTLTLVHSALEIIEDKLSDNKEFKILPKLKSWKEDCYKFDRESREGKNLIKELDNGRLYCAHQENETVEILKSIYRATKLGIEENGANTLYLALGMLQWKEDNADKVYLAPILLLPAEIVRKGSGYVIRSRDEETVFNITLIEMLRQKFDITISGINPLPRDEHGVDVDRIFGVLRKTIIRKKGWDVLEKAVLGNFLFNKFILWNDIHGNFDKISKNKIVKSLIDNRLAWEDTENLCDARELDVSVEPAGLALPVPADSSQLEAVYAAANGKSFILHGPPGTGKSQTITNIIANALYQNKRVLFVAEKMAALSVVKTRLEKIGLAPFCLELHSNKARKTEVFAQLKKTTEILRGKTPADFEREAERLFNLRKRLNGYVEGLHEKTHAGISLYQAIARYCSLEECAKCDVGDFVFAAPERFESEKIADWRDCLNEMRKAAEALNVHPALHPLRSLELPDFSGTLKVRLSAAFAQGRERLKAFREIFESVAAESGIAFPRTKEAVDAFCVLAATLKKTKAVNALWLRTPGFERNAAALKTFIDSGCEFKKLEDSLRERFGGAVYTIPAKKMLEEWENANSKFFVFKWLEQRGLRKQVEASLVSGKVWLPEDLKKIRNCQKMKKNLEENSCARFFEQGFPENAAAWDECRAAVAGTLAVLKALKPLAKSASEANAQKLSLSERFKYGFDVFLDANGDLLDSLEKSVESLAAVDRALESIGGLRTDAGDPAAGDSFFEARDRLLENLGNNLEYLKDWYRYLQERQKAEACGFKEFTDFLGERPELAVADWQPFFEKSLCKAVVEFLLGNDKKLLLFKGEVFEKTIAEYRSRTAQYQEITKAELFARIVSRLPDFTLEASRNSEIGILMRGIESKGRGLSLRDVFDKTANLLERLCPCMLMSPMSIAQFLNMEKHRNFDLVIFDEASQLPTSEAVGAIARAENLVVVGDAKQMPPTSFFSTTNIDEDAAEVCDLESILDDCLALKMSSKHLQFHYRSKHESLIAFSNTHYYDGKLKTFPSPDNREKKVLFVKTDGCYERGRMRRNSAEADAVVREIERRLRDPELRKYSIGVVTFNISQQNLIDDLLLKKFAENPELERIAHECEEPIFVKNLENVQGDERDVILFSITYGPDKDGRVSLNFGPLNSAGGERRLNVAVSRARYEMMVFSTLTADMIDLGRTSAAGVAGLHGFLKFAETGTLATVNYGTEPQTEASVNKIIAAALEKSGYEVDTNIGTSGFRIDIGIVDPDNENRYLLGILCDGEYYREAKTARDREVCQPGILKMLGWNLLKVWTLDWWENREAVLEKIETAIEEVRKGNAEALPLSETPESRPVEWVDSDPGDRSDRSYRDTPSGYRKAVLDILKEQFSLPQADIFKAVAGKFGLERVSQTVKRQTLLAIEELILKKKIIRSDDERLMLS